MPASTAGMPVRPSRQAATASGSSCSDRKTARKGWGSLVDGRASMEEQVMVELPPGELSHERLGGYAELSCGGLDLKG
jgi:hypothetical protein